MNSIIDEIHATGKPDFPFCLGWANESWKAKQWRQDGAGDKILMEQRYEGELDYRLHYEYVYRTGISKTRNCISYIGFTGEGCEGRGCVTDCIRGNGYGTTFV